MPRPKARKKNVRLTNALKAKIIDYMADGLNIAEMCRQDKSLPTPRTIRQAQLEDSEFGDAITRGYIVKMLSLIDEEEELTNTPLSVLYPNMEFKEANEHKKHRLNTIRHWQDKVAPTLDNRFNKVQKVEHTGNVTGNGINVVIPNYYAQPVDLSTKEYTRLSDNETNKGSSNH